MKMLRTLFILYISATTAGCINSNKKISLTEKIDNIVNLYSSEAHIGIAISDKNNKHIYSENYSNLFTPASNVKLFTAYAALEYLNENFKYYTSIYYEKNNIYIKFTGDPTLRDNDLNDMITYLKNINLPKIDKIIIDDSYFDQEYIPKGRSTGDEIYCFAAPISSIILNNNCFDVIIDINNYKDNILTTREPVISEISANITINDNDKLQYNIDNIKGNYLLTGNFSSKELPKKISIAYYNPRIMIEKYIKHYFNLNQLKFNDVEFSKAPSDVKPIYVKESIDLAEIIKIMLKNSDNLYADVMVKTIAKKFSKNPGNMTDGIDYIKQIFKNNQILQNISIYDGSGLSYYNLISPRQMIELLDLIEKTSYIDIIKQSLPVMGVDGTLKENQTYSIKSRIFAKTGTLNSSINLTGYTDRYHKFVIFFNNFKYNKSEMQKARDKILETLLYQ